MKTVGVFAPSKEEFERYRNDHPHRKCVWFQDRDSILSAEVNFLVTTDPVLCYERWGNAFDEMRELGRTRVRN